MSERTKIESPRLQRLAEEVRQGDTGATASFWEEMTESGTPLIEPIEGETDRSLVTFLWRATERVGGVDVISLVTGLRDNALQLLPGTDVWHRSWPVASDVRATYQFFPRTGGPAEDASAMARLASYVHDPLNRHTYTFERDEEDPDGFELVRSVLRMPKAAAQPLNERGADVSAGTIEMHLSLIHI